MRGRFDAIAVIALLLCAVVIAGEVMTYAQVHHYDSDVEWGEDSATVTVSSSGTDRYDAVVIDNGFRVPMKEVFVFVDENYAQYYDEASEISRIDYADQDSVSKEFQKYLAARSFRDVQLGGSLGLNGYLESTLDNPGGCGLIVTSYALPHQVYDGTTVCLLVKWLEAGGTLYWMNSETGRFYIDEDGLHEVSGASALFFGNGYQNTSGPTVADSKVDNGFTDALSLKNSNMHNALCVDGVEGAITMGYSAEGFSSIAGVPLGDGQVFVLSGRFDFDLTDDLSQIISASVSVSSFIVGHYDGVTTGGSARFEMSIPSDSNIVLYVFIGGTFTKFGEAFYG